MNVRCPCLPGLLLSLLVLLPGPAAGETAGVALPERAGVAEKIFGLPELPNLGRVSPTFYRGAQPGEGGFALLKRMGIRTVINLRYTHSEKEEVEAAGLRSVEVPMNTFGRVDEDAVQKVLSVLAAGESHPVFLHCRHGKDRTGMIVALYRMAHQGWSKEAAVAEMKDYGFNSTLFRLKNYVRDYNPPAKGP
jgi:protein tyrosine/serine phosphatase